MDRLIDQLVGWSLSRDEDPQNLSQRAGLRADHNRSCRRGPAVLCFSLCPTMMRFGVVELHRSRGERGRRGMEQPQSSERASERRK